MRLATASAVSAYKIVAELQSAVHTISALSVALCEIYIFASCITGRHLMQCKAILQFNVQKFKFTFICMLRAQTL